MISLSTIFRELELRDIRRQSIISSDISKKNKKFNKYLNILTYDHALPLIQNNGYLNASVIEFKNFNSKDDSNQIKWIATQSPMISNLYNFYLTLIEYKVQNVIQLTITNVDQYLPSPHQTLKLNDLSIKFESLVDVNEDYDLKLFTITNSKENITHSFHHYYYKQWPDHSIPNSKSSIINLINKVSQSDCNLVHCSAGIGRTGSFIILQELLRLKSGNIPINKNFYDDLTQQYTNNDNQNILFNCIDFIRRSRPMSIEFYQFKWLNQFL